MKYISTRGQAPELSFKEALLTGLASDGGLYVPKSWPEFDADKIRSFCGKPYHEVAFEVMKPFVGGDIADDPLRAMIEDAYASFQHPATVPLVQSGPNEWILEIFYGPTLAFKDVAMQIIARLMDYILSEKGERMTIVGATSGDTGGAALEAFKGCAGIDVFFMFPNGKVSDVQRKQMTTIGSANAHALAINGTFDDCQNMVKAMFAHDAFREGVNLSAVNSINWGRVMAQLVYYFTSAATLGAPEQAVSYTVPTGNFGDIYAGYAAKKMGLPIDRLIIATNENDVLRRTLETGRYEIGTTAATVTPSMDIQISSNFERLLYDALGGDTAVLTELLSGLKSSGQYTLPKQALAFITGRFEAGSADQAETIETIKNVFDESGYLADPHTAVAIRVARQNAGETPMVVLSTAHPAKFPDTVKSATGVFAELPTWSAQHGNNKEEFTVLDADQPQVEAHIQTRLRQTARTI